MQQKTGTSVSLKRDFFSLIFVYLKQILKLFLFICILFTKKINLCENIYFYVFILYLISGGHEKISMIKKGH